MKEDLLFGINLIENEDYEEAYQYFNNMLTENPKNIDAKYYRAVVDFFHIRRKLYDDYNDFKFLVDKKTKYKEVSLPLLCFICDELQITNEAILYGELAFNLDHPYKTEITNILIKSLLSTNNQLDAIHAMALIDSIIEEDEDANLDIYVKKAELQFKFHDYDGALATIEQIQTRFSSNAQVYFLKAKLALTTVKENEKAALDDAIYNLKIALQFDELFNGARLLLAECYALDGNINLALETLDEFRTNLSSDISDKEKTIFESDLVVEKVKLCEITKDFELAIQICEGSLKNHDSWKVRYSLGYIQNLVANTLDELRVAKENIKKAYLESNQVFLITDVVNLNTILKEFNESNTLINEALKKEPNNGLLYYLKAENNARFNYNYDELISLYHKALELGYLDLPTYVMHISFLVENPLKLSKKYHKLLLNSKKDNPWDMRRAGIRYLFGEFGFKQRLDYAYNFLSNANLKEPNEPCIMTMYARCLELMNNHDEAFKVYLDAYEIYKNSIHMTCNCANGYLAHAYIKGIGTSIDLDKAKSLTLDAINKDEGLSASINIYHYAYFALNEETNFNLEKAYLLLQEGFAFDRYDIVRMLYLDKVCKKLNINSIYTIQDFQNCLKHTSKEYKKFYNETKDLDNFYPYHKSF